MKMNEKSFFKTEFGAELECTVKALDIALEEKAKHETFSEEWRKEQKAIDELFTRLDVYKQGLRTFYVSPALMNILGSAQKMKVII